MTHNLDLAGALLVGLAGSAHCIGMCGGVSAALSMAIPANKQHFWGRLAYLLNYNLGRILSYVIAGALVGGLLATTSELGAGKHAIAGLRVVAALLMIALGLYLAGWWQGILLLERLGARIWPRIKPLAGKFLPFTSPVQALPFGMVWGWLPCGLVYSMLTWSAAAGFGQWRGADHALFWSRHPAHPVCVGRACRSPEILAHPAQFAPWRCPAAHFVRGAYLLDWHCFLLKPYPKRMS